MFVYIDEFEFVCVLFRVVELLLLVNVVYEVLNLLEYGYWFVEVIIMEIEEVGFVGG